MNVFIIAEAGVNHNGSIKLAKKLVDKAKEANVNAIKFQTFKAENLVSSNTPLAKYQQKNFKTSNNQFEMLKKLELTYSDFEELKYYCDKKGIVFLSSPFDIESARFLKSLGLEIFKIPSGEITNYPYLSEIGSYGRKVILSTGMADLGEIEDAVDVLISAGTNKEDIILLHCNTEYPTSYEDVNLKAMLTLKEAFKLKVGYSDHTEGIEVALSAVALGAEVIEKHFTLDKTLAGPDHRASVEPRELKEMVRAIRNIEKALGDGIKKPTESERGNKSVVRKSIVAKRFIRKGEVFTEENLATKRPADGISPMRWNEVIGRKARRDFKKDELIEL